MQRTFQQRRVGIALHAECAVTWQFWSHAAGSGLFKHTGASPHRVKELQGSAAESTGTEVLRAFAQLIDAHEVLGLPGSKGRGQVVQLLHLEALVSMARKPCQWAVPIKAAVEKGLVLQHSHTNSYTDVVRPEQS